MELEILVNNGSGNGLLPDGTKPLPEPMLTDQQQRSAAVISSDLADYADGSEVAVGDNWGVSTRGPLY